MRVLGLCFLVLGLAACSTTWDPHLPAQIPRGALEGPRGDAPRCTRLLWGAEGPYRVPLAGPETDPELKKWLAEVPAEVRRVFLAAGLEPALARLLRDREAELDLEWVARRQAISNQLQSLHVQLNASLHEADCAGDLLETLRGNLEQEESTRELQWSVLSIVVGAAAAIASGVGELIEQDSREAVVIGIAGGAASAALGIVAFLPRSRRIVLNHERNLLAPLIQGEDPDYVYPSFVFRLLTLPEATGGTPREHLLLRWDAIVRREIPEDQQSRAAQLLYGDGGIYDLHLLSVRERLLDELESSIAAFARELELAQRYLSLQLDQEKLQSD